ncbi:MAG: hypothetical protein WD492_00340 [Alkalispirochaeta sp.]
MIQAELRGKIGFSGVDESDVREIERMEDLLTSNVFGVLKNLGADAWGSLLPEDMVADYRSDSISIDFWPRYAGETAASALPGAVKNTEPDIVVETRKFIAIIEVKYLSSFGRQVGETDHQLIREWQLGSAIATSKGKTFRLVTLTPFANSVETEVRSLFPGEDIGRGVHVRYWEDLYAGLRKLADDSPEGIEKSFIRDLVDYLQSKGFDAEKVAVEKQRSLSYWFGEDDTERFLTAVEAAVGAVDRESEILTIPVASLSEDAISKLADALMAFCGSEAISKSPLSNTVISKQSILPNFLLETEGKPVSDFFYWILSEAYYAPYLRLNGKNDFSVKGRIRNRGNAEISLFTVRSKDLTVTVYLRR